MQAQDLVSIPLFKGMDISDLQRILPLVDEMNYPGDSIIFSQDQYADYFYILREGEVEIRYKPYDGPFLRVATVGQGEVFGWSSLLRHECYTSAAITVMQSLAYRISGLALQRMCEKHPATGLILLERLSRVISSRLNATQAEVAKMLQNGLQNEPENHRKGTSDE